MIKNIDCLEYLSQPGPEHRCIFADIPDNIGLGYVGFSDHIPNYWGWIQRLIFLAQRRCEILWLSYNAKWDLEVKKLIPEHDNWSIRQIIWRYTFGQYNDHDFASGYRPIILFKKRYITLNFDSIRVESARQKLNDKRAVGPRVPDDVWELARVVGNAKERRDWHPTQHPEALLERIIKLSCTNKEGVCGSICDLCLGSGTTAIVAKRLGVPWVGCEISPFYCSMIESELRK